MARRNSRSKPRRLSVSTRKSVSAWVSSSAMRACAARNSALSKRSRTEGPAGGLGRLRLLAKDLERDLALDLAEGLMSRTRAPAGAGLGRRAWGRLRARLTFFWARK